MVGSGLVLHVDNLWAIIGGIVLIVVIIGFIVRRSAAKNLHRRFA